MATGSVLEKVPWQKATPLDYPLCLETLRGGRGVVVKIFARKRFPNHDISCNHRAPVSWCAQSFRVFVFFSLSKPTNSSISKTFCMVGCVCLCDESVFGTQR